MSRKVRIADTGSFVDLGKSGAQTSPIRSYLLCQAQSLVLGDIAVQVELRSPYNNKQGPRGEEMPWAR